MESDELGSVLLIANGSLLLFLGLCATALNGLLLGILIKDRTNTFNKPLYNIDLALLFSHLSAGLVALPYLGIKELLYGTHISQQEAVRYASFGTVLINFIPAYRLMIMPTVLMERYTAFVRPHWCAQFTSRRITVGSVILAGLCFLLDMVQFMDVKADTFYTFYFLVAILLPVLISVVLVLTIYWEIKIDRALRRVETGIPPNEDNVQRSRMRRNRRAKKFVFIAVVVMIPPILCVVPWYVLQIVCFHRSDCVSNRPVSILNTFLLSLLLAETTITPLTSIFKFPEYRHAVKRMFCATTN